MKTFYTLIAFGATLSLYAQTPPDIDALETIIVEKYYVSGPDDVQDGLLPEGSTTYRVYADMKPGYKVLSVVGQTHHPLILETTGLFYNSSFGSTFGGNFLPFLLNFDTAVLDSYITIGSCAQGYLGTPKELDPDGSLLTGAEGYLQNLDPSTGPSLLEQDGFIPGEGANVGVLGIDDELNDAFGLSTSSGSINTDNGVWFDLEGLEGSTDDNIVMIGQFTTTECDFSFKLNMQIIIPEELRTDQRVTIVFVSDFHPTDQVLNDSGDNYIFYEKEALTFVAECAPISTDNQLLSAENFNVVPNPSAGLFSIFADRVLSGFSANVFDLQGRLVESQYHANSFPEAGVQLDLTKHPDGIYLVHIITDDGHGAAKKVVKTK